MPSIDLSILNQRQTPAFYADTLANRPAAGFVGRIFVSTNTFAFYRDNGTSWDLIGGPGTGTVTGSGAVNQVTYWNGTSTITGDNGLYYDSTNDFLGIGTNAPGAAIDVHSTINVIAQLNQLTATNNSLLAFQNAGSGLWRIGNYYNAAANDFAIFDVIGAKQSITIKKTTGQTFIGAEVTSSGLLTVNSATSDNHIVVTGANAPSIRLNNGTAVKQAGFGISTAVNNFIQGSADRDFCIFNGSTTASPILFGIWNGTNNQEAARISTARNLLVGSSTDTGQAFQVTGTSKFSSNVTIGNTTTFGSLKVNVGTNQNISINSLGGVTHIEAINDANTADVPLRIDATQFQIMGGNVGIGVSPSAWDTTSGYVALQVSSGGLYSRATTNETYLSGNAYYNVSWKYINTATATRYDQVNGSHAWFNASSGTAGNTISFTQAMTLTNGGLLGIGTTAPGAALNVSGINVNAAIDWTNTTAVTGRTYRWVSMNGGNFGIEDITGGGVKFTLKSTGIVNITNTPVYATNALALAGGLVAGDIYKSATGVLSIVY